MNLEYGVLSLCDHLADPTDGRGISQQQRLQDVARQAQLAERAGFDSFGVGEHHFSDYILPTPELLLSYAAAATTSIRLGTSVTLLANRDPLSTAEAFSVLDVLSGGRAEATFARGVSKATARAFGFVDFDEMRPRFEEYLRLVLRLLTEDQVTWSGSYRGPLTDVRIEPRPLQEPRSALWVGGGLSQVSAKLAAELGLPLLLPSLFRWPKDYEGIVGFYRSKAEEASNVGRVGFPSYVHVAQTSQQAKARWRPYLNNYVTFAGGVRGSFGRSTDFDDLLTGPAICGSPAEVVERVAEINETLGLNRHLFMMDAGGLPLDVVAEAIDLVGSDVLPHLRQI